LIEAENGLDLIRCETAPEGNHWKAELEVRGPLALAIKVKLIVG
jgi:hypothetical protein